MKKFKTFCFKHKKLFIMLILIEFLIAIALTINLNVQRINPLLTTLFALITLFSVICYEIADHQAKK